MAKSQIMEALGETELLMPRLLDDALAANDRLKYCLTLLQVAAAHARNPDEPASNLKHEREASAVDDSSFDEVVPASHPLDADTASIPGLARVLALIAADLRQMLRPVKAAADAGLDPARTFEAFARRLDQLVALQTPKDDRVAYAAIDAMTRAGEDGRDSVHQLVMDLHRAVNRLQQSIATESIDGAHSYGMTDAFRRLVRAFMKGVNDTARLKFDHPGLGTTAAGTGDRLSIQNDIGTTEAHVVVIHVRGLTATLMYSDVHRRRSAFLRDMLAKFPITWHAGTAPADADYELSIGHFMANDEDSLARYLTFLGSRLVFLIDWNRARKKLGKLVPKADAIAVLKWAADNNIGHRAFLQLGGPELIHTAFERTAPDLAHGARLDGLLGRDDAFKFLTSVLSIANTALTSGRSVMLVEDEVEAALLSHLHKHRYSTLDAAAEHAMLLAAMAERLRLTFVQASAHRNGEPARTAQLESQWESRADRIVHRWTHVSDHGGTQRSRRQLLVAGDEAADALEHSAFLLTLVPAGCPPHTLTGIAKVAELVDASAREYVRCLEFARHSDENRGGADLDRCLIAVDRLAAIELDCGRAVRTAIASLVQDAPGFRELHVLSEVAHALDGAARAIGRCGALVRDHALHAGAELA